MSRCQHLDHSNHILNRQKRERDYVMPNQITGPNAGGLRQFPIRTPLAARVGQFWRSSPGYSILRSAIGRTYTESTRNLWR